MTRTSTSGGQAETTTVSAPISFPPATGHPAPIPSAALLRGRDVVTIEHEGCLYHLRRTRQGKLILTK